MSAISTVMINKITPLKLHLDSRTAQSGIINSWLINHGWLTNLFITNTLLNSSHLSTAHFSRPNRTGSLKKQKWKKKKTQLFENCTKQQVYYFGQGDQETAHLKVFELHRQLSLGTLNLEALTLVVSNLSTHKNHLEGLLKTRFLGPTSRASDPVGLEGSLRICFSNKLQTRGYRCCLSRDHA